MTRPLRHNQAGCDYHVYNRVANGDPMFHDDFDRRFLLRRLPHMAARHPVKILSFCLMGNHLHLVVRCEEACLDAFMRDLMSGYVRHFNDRYDIEGRMCRDRYQSKPVLSRAYLHALGVYVHRNPVDLGFEGRLLEYPWSSLAFLSAAHDAPWWLDPEPVLTVVGGPDRLLRAVERSRRLKLPGDATPAEIYEAWAIQHLTNAVGITSRSYANLAPADVWIAGALVALESTDLSQDALREVFGMSRSAIHRGAVRAQVRCREDRTFARIVDQLRIQFD